MLEGEEFVKILQNDGWSKSLRPVNYSQKKADGTDVTIGAKEFDVSATTKSEFEKNLQKKLSHENPNPKPLVKAILVFPLLKNVASIWHIVAQTFSNDNQKDLEGLNAKNRANKFKVMKEVYHEELELNTKKLNYAFFSIIIKIADENNLNKDQVVAIIKKAKQRGGIYNQADSQGNYLKKVDLKNIAEIKIKNFFGIETVSVNKAQKFSADFQKECEKCGIYSGREDGKDVGLRTTFIPDDVVEQLSSETNVFKNSKAKENAKIFVNQINKEVRSTVAYAQFKDAYHTVCSR